jgi:hypothetical protein
VDAGVALEDYSRLILIGHGGNLMWRRLQKGGATGANPVDEYSTRLAVRLVKEFLDDCAYLVLYPGYSWVPLQQLGAVAGWHHDSPLGIGVNPIYGPWFGYRAALLVHADIPVYTVAGASSPCERCADTPCVSTCPAKALSVGGAPDVVSCVDHRISADSACALRCLAREACPTGADHRYVEGQIRYFYGRSLDSIRAILRRSGNRAGAGASD